MPLEWKNPDHTLAVTTEDTDVKILVGIVSQKIQDFLGCSYVFEDMGEEKFPKHSIITVIHKRVEPEISIIHPESGASVYVRGFLSSYLETEETQEL